MLNSFFSFLSLLFLLSTSLSYFFSYIITTFLPSISPLMIHTKQQGDKIVIAHWNEDPLLQMRRTCYILRDLPIWSPKIRTLCLVHRLLLLYQNLGDLLIPTVIEECLWSTSRDKMLCKRLQATLA